MPTTGSRRVANPVKDRGASKRRTKETTDQARPRSARRSTRQTVTGQGGSPKGHRGGASSPHPGQHGGVKYDTPNLEEATNSRKGKHTGRKAPGSGLIKAPSRKWSPAEGRTRTGGRATKRRRSRAGQRQRGR